MKIFLSYANKDRDEVDLWVNEFRKHGIDVSTDIDLPAGESFLEQIQDSIESCSGVISFVSPASANSEWAQTEAALALKSAKPVLPVLVEDCSVEGPLSFYNMLDARNAANRDAQVGQAMEVIEGWL